MKKNRLIPLIAMALALLGGHFCLHAADTGGHAGEQKFKLGIQAWTLRKTSFVEMLDELERQDIRHVQAYSRQKLGEGFGDDECFHHSMSADTREKVLALLRGRKVTVLSYGVVTGKDEGEWRRIFEFAKAMGMRDISIEPKYPDWPQVLPLVAGLAKEYGIGVGIHNHPDEIPPSVYLERLKDYDELIKYTPDTGAWALSGFDPVECLKAVAGRIQSVHLKDAIGRTRKSSLVPWGTGASNVPGQLLELRRQGFDGIVYIEMGYSGRPITRDVELCAEYFRRAAAATDSELLEAAVIPPGYTSPKKSVNIMSKKKSGRWESPAPLLRDDLSDAVYSSDTWEMRKGVLSCMQPGILWTKEDYGDFALGGEFRCGNKASGGIVLRSTGKTDWRKNAIVFQILQGDSENPSRLVGAMRDCQEPSRQVEIEPGQWYRFLITAKDRELNFHIDGERLNRIRLEQWKEAGKNPDGTSNPSDHPYESAPLSGKIGFEGLDSPLEFRNLSVEKF